MPSLDQLEALILSADQGSFSAAARKLNKAQSAVSTAVMNLEIETGVELFDRSKRSPILTPEGEALVRQARAVLKGNNDFMALARAFNTHQETHLCLAIEQSIALKQLVHVLHTFEQTFPFIELELLDPGTNDVANLLRRGRADLGLMMEQEQYPLGFRFRGIGYSKLLAVCHKDHPLTQILHVNHSDLRQHRQLVNRALDKEDTSHERHIISPQYWFAESPYIISELLAEGIGWALLPEAVIAEQLDNGKLVRLELSYQQVPALQGIDVVWTEKKSLGPAGQWLKEQLFKLKLS